MNILGIGIATLDVINLVDEYPMEDAEVRASRQWLSRGGNATNTLVVLSQLGQHCSWGGVLSRDQGGEFIHKDLQSYRIAMNPVVYKEGHTPTSYVALSCGNGSRTIVHYRDLPEYSMQDFSSIDLEPFGWIHFEGRNPIALKAMLQQTIQVGICCSLEVEKPREGIEALFSLPGLLLFSKSYAQQKGYQQAEPFLLAMRRIAGPGKRLVCAWGEEGAWALDKDDIQLHSPAFPPPIVVDSLGAGDVFNAGIINGLARGDSLQRVLIDACRMAGRQCGREGLVIDGFDEC